MWMNLPSLYRSIDRKSQHITISHHANSERVTATSRALAEITAQTTEKTVS
jgi:hypothetical protein